MELADPIFFILIIIFVILAIRHIVCWYYKINKLVEQNDEIIGLLEKIYKVEQER